MYMGKYDLKSLQYPVLNITEAEVEILLWARAELCKHVTYNHNVTHWNLCPIIYSIMGNIPLIRKIGDSLYPHYILYGHLSNQMIGWQITSLPIGDYISFQRQLRIEWIDRVISLHRSSQEEIQEGL